MIFPCSDLTQINAPLTKATEGLIILSFIIILFINSRPQNQSLPRWQPSSPNCRHQNEGATVTVHGAPRKVVLKKKTTIK